MRKYIDRWGQYHTPNEQSVFKERSGVFAIIIAREKILLTWPNCAPDIPELPGGGIENGEDLSTALMREIKEEADINMKLNTPKQLINQDIGLYADYDDEFWNYTQTYWVIDKITAEQHYFEGEKHPSDALKSGWLPIKNINKTTLHAVHAQVLGEILQ